MTSKEKKAVKYIILTAFVVVAVILLGNIMLFAGGLTLFNKLVAIKPKR